MEVSSEDESTYAGHQMTHPENEGESFAHVSNKSDGRTFNK
jgi:hypothetical protein